MAQEAGAAPARPSPAPSSLGSKSGQDVPPSEPDLEGFSGDEKNGRVQHGLSMAQRIMHSLSGTVASFTGTRQQQLVTHYSSVAALSGETADELCAKPTSWLEGDVVLANVSVAKIVGDESGEWTDECAWEPPEQPAVPRENCHWILSVHPALVEHYAGGSVLDQY